MHNVSLFRKTAVVVEEEVEEVDVVTVPATTPALVKPLSSNRQHV